jgi:hypothetical protein
MPSRPSLRAWAKIVWPSLATCASHWTPASASKASVAGNVAFGTPSGVGEEINREDDPCALGLAGAQLRKGQAVEIDDVLEVFGSLGVRFWKQLGIFFERFEVAAPPVDVVERFRRRQPRGMRPGRARMLEVRFATAGHSFAVTQITGNIPAPRHDACVEHEAEPPSANPANSE